MNQFFLLNESICTDDFEYFKNGMSELVAIEREDADRFLKHESLWNEEIISKLYSNYGGLTEKAICYFIETLESNQVYINDEVTFDAAYPDLLNAFIGINFANTTVSEKKQIRDDASYRKLLYDDLWNVTFRNLWNKRTKLFPNITLCGEVERQINLIGGARHFNQVIEILKKFNEAVTDWTTGDFSYKNINQNYALRISPESTQTMSAYGSERIFSLPTGGTRIFELHIKTGDLRFHFYPDNITKKVFVGYIGQHLSTVTN